MGDVQGRAVQETVAVVVECEVANARVVSAVPRSHLLQGPENSPAVVGRTDLCLAPDGSLMNKVPVAPLKVEEVDV
jgi:hypothetical protein